MSDETNTAAGMDAAEQGADQSASLQSIIGGLLGNPAIMAMINSSVGGGGREAEERETAAAQSVSTAEESGTARPDLSGGIGKLFSNPDMLAKLPGMISAIMPLLGGGSDSPKPATEQGPVGPAKETAAIPAQSGASAAPLAFLKRRGKCCDKHLRLMQALKPYLNSERQQTVDTIVKINKISEAFQTK